MSWNMPMKYVGKKYLHRIPESSLKAHKLELSVVILNYNVRYFLNSVFARSEAIRNLEAEIIVIDNASSDESGSMVASLFPEVIYIKYRECRF